MAKERRTYSEAEKVAMLREHLIEQVPCSKMCEKHEVPAR